MKGFPVWVPTLKIDPLTAERIKIFTRSGTSVVIFRTFWINYSYSSLLGDQENNLIHNIWMYVLDLVIITQVIFYFYFIYFIFNFYCFLCRCCFKLQYCLLTLHCMCTQTFKGFSNCTYLKWWKRRNRRKSYISVSSDMNFSADIYSCCKY